ncbi:hemerythrin domain-containing protein [Rhodoferax sp.]|uniref:hemerythrin domain-containing protein n=1 Tax=Rhodoferax sp. TaxID=50421 RepID=UPI00283ED75D|nr:hemerythrin domain-containing protein [Rhodoferax sp.]MDR3370297.1 hemerythrin domain-containing protein [Rhodoferax sp.]
MKAIDIIHAEHRALGAVLQALCFILDGVRSGARQPDFVLLEAMITYITDVPDKLHHPKEDEVLFVKILDVIPEAAALIDKLKHEHEQGARSTLALRDALQQYKQTGSNGFASFDRAASTYIESSWNHLGIEEKELLPLARQRLAPQDWAGIDAAFEANKDPWSGPAGEYKALFSRIVNMVPAPYGVGPG